MVNESPPPAQGRRVVGFEYTGRTSMTVLGPSTWRRYNFECSGAIVNVDARDAEEMVAVPHLRPVFTDTAKPL